MGEWLAEYKEYVIAVGGFIQLIIGALVVRWVAAEMALLRATADSKYEAKRSEAEERAHKADHRKETEQMCDEWYVRRQRYHDDINTISEQIGRVRLDMEKANVAIAIIGTTMTNIAETSKEQGATLRAILLHTQELNRRDAAWKPETGIPATVDPTHK